MTKGKPLKLLLSFAIPLLLGNVFQQIYNMADTFIVGRTLGVHALAGVGAAGSLMFLIMGFIQGVSSGLAVPLAQAYGAKDYPRLRRSFALNILVSLVVSVLMTIFSLTQTRHLLDLMGTPKEIYQEAFLYIHVIFAGLILFAILNGGLNCLRALGDSRMPLIFLIMTSLVNVVLDITFILALGMGVEGAAYATLASVFLADVMIFFYIGKKVKILLPKKEDWRIRQKELSRHLTIGLPIGFQSSIIAIGAIILQTALNGLGADVVAVYTTVSKIEQLGIQILMSFGMTMATYIGQNYGAKKYERMWAGVTTGVKISLVMSWLMGGFFYLLADRLVGLFITGEHPHILALGRQYFHVTVFFYSFLALLFIYRYTIQGLGHSLVPTFAGILELCTRTFSAWVLIPRFGFLGGILAAPLSWIMALLPVSITYYYSRRHLRSKEKHKSR